MLKRLQCGLRVAYLDLFSLTAEMATLQLCTIKEFCRYKHISKDIFFQQDVATPHSIHSVRAWLTSKLDSGVILKTGRPRPPDSPDLGPLDFFLRSNFKNVVYKVQPQTTIEPKTSIVREVRIIIKLQISDSEFHEETECQATAKWTSF